MMHWLLLLCLLTTTVLGEKFEEDIENAKNGTIWAVLVAGSNGLAYYRHQGRQVIDDLFSNIMSKAGASNEEINSYMTLNMEMFPCHKTLTKAFRDTCVDTNKNGYVVGHYYKLANLCLRDNFNAEDALRIVSEECKEHHRQLSGIN